MRTAGLSTLVALLSYRVAALAPECHNDEPLPSDEVAKSSIMSATMQRMNNMTSLCTGTDIYSDPSNQAALVFENSRSDLAGEADLARCQTAFEIIISQCVLGKGMLGGEIEENGVTYMISSSSSAKGVRDENSLETRGRKKKSKAKVGTKTGTKTGGDSNTTPKKKTPTPTPAPPTQCELPPRKPAARGLAGLWERGTKKKGKGQTDTGCNAPKGATSCKDIAAGRFKGGKTTKTKKPRKTPRLAARDLFIRDKKTLANGPCGATRFESNDFKNWHQHIAAHPDTIAYGFVDPVDCTDYTFVDSSVKSAEYKTSLDNKATYATEHIIEWQTVGGFFDYMAGKKLIGLTVPPNTKKTYPDPEFPPSANKPEIEFGPYWRKSWSYNDAQAFALPGGVRRTPFQHIADAYPSDKEFTSELVILQSKLNGIKSYVFGDKSAKDKSTIIKEIKDIGNPEKARKAVLKLRDIAGTRMYLENRNIKKIFDAQAKRIADVLDDLEAALPNHPRIVGGVTYQPWRPMHLSTAWKSYIDGAWKGALAELKDMAEEFSQDIEQKWCTSAKKAEWNANKAQHANEIALCEALDGVKSHMK